MHPQPLKVGGNMDDPRARRQRLLVGIYACIGEFNRRGIPLPFFEDLDEMSLKDLSSLLFHLRTILYYS